MRVRVRVHVHARVRVRARVHVHVLVRMRVRMRVRVSLLAATITYKVPPASLSQMRNNAPQTDQPHGGQAHQHQSRWIQAVAAK